MVGETSEVTDGVRRIVLGEFGVTDTSAPPPELGSQSGNAVEAFRSKLRVEVVKKAGFDMEFDLIGVDPSLANAVRRILLSDVPSMAIEKVYMYNNTSIIQDEVLAHRLGLIPLRADPRKFEFYHDHASSDGIYGNAKNTLEFELKVKCKRNPDAPDDAEDPDDLYIDHKIFTKHMKWIPRKGQIQMLSGKPVFFPFPDRVFDFPFFSDGKETTPNPGPVEDDILISKMRPGHEMDIKVFAVKGVGRDHAKFSPVATASYRLLPEITLHRPVYGEAAERLQACFSPGVIALEDDKNGKKAVVRDTRYDACSRNVFRHEDLADAVTMAKVPDHFIFTVESVGAMPPEDLVTQALTILEKKCDIFIKELDASKK